MKLTIIRIENEIVTAELDDGNMIDIEKMWLEENIYVNQIIDFDIHKCQSNQ